MRNAFRCTAGASSCRVYIIFLAEVKVYGIFVEDCQRGVKCDLDINAIEREVAECEVDTISQANNLSLLLAQTLSLSH